MAASTANTFGQQLRKLRTGNNLRQRDVAELLGVERSTIANWENGNKQPELDNVLRVATTFNISLDELLLGRRSAPGGNNEAVWYLASDPLVKLLAQRTGVAATVIGAFIAAMQATNRHDNHHPNLNGDGRPVGS